MIGRKTEIREVTDLELTELKRQLIRYLRALDAPYNGGCCSHHGLYFKAGEDITVSLLGETNLRVLVDAYVRGDNGYGAHSYLTPESWEKIARVIEECAGKIGDKCEGTLTEKGQYHMDFELEMMAPLSFRFAQEANSRLPGSGSLDRRNDAKFKRWDDWLEARLKIVDDMAIEVKK